MIINTVLGYPVFDVYLPVAYLIFHQGSCIGCSQLHSVCSVILDIAPYDCAI